MGKVDYAMFVRIVAVVFSVSEDLYEFNSGWMSRNYFLFIDLVFMLGFLQRYDTGRERRFKSLSLFLVSAVTAFTFAMVRLLNPDMFYQQEPIGSLLALHYFVCGLILVTSVIGFLNSSIVMFRSTTLNSGKNITKWLLFDSLFETARVLYLFISEVLLHSVGTVHMYDMILGGAQYLLDSLLYCQVILKKQ